MVAAAKVGEHATFVIKLLCHALHLAELFVEGEGTLTLEHRTIELQTFSHVVFVHFLSIFFGRVRRNQREIFARLLVAFC